MNGLSSKEWAAVIERGLRQHDAQQKIARRKRLKELRKYITIPVIVGLVCTIIYLTFFGWEWLIRGVLTATISATIITTMLAVLADIKME